MPTDIPKNFNDVMPKGGFSGIFSSKPLPQLLTISYWIYLASALLWLLTTIPGLIFSFITLGLGRYWIADGIRGIVVSVISLAIIVAIVITVLKLKEGLQWPRLALTILSGVTFILGFFGAFTGWLTVIAAVFLWLPESTNWFNAQKAGVPYVPANQTPAPGYAPGYQPGAQQPGYQAPGYTPPQQGYQPPTAPGAEGQPGQYPGPGAGQ